jgi:hypothetical protein
VKYFLHSGNSSFGDNFELVGDRGAGNGSLFVRLSNSGTIDSKHSETGDNVEMIGDAGDCSKTLDSILFFLKLGYQNPEQWSI